MDAPKIDAEALRTLQAPLKSKYREDAGAATITLKARGHVDEAKIACKVETGRAIAEAGLHPLTGGSGAELCSGDMLLEALVACAGVTLKAVATAVGVTLKAAEVVAEGDLDFRGTLGVDKEAAVGFKAIRVTFNLDTDADEAQVAQLIKLTERYCVVFQTLKAPPQSSVSVVRAP
jgi:uncharacterized OsmC-like protein